MKVENMTSSSGNKIANQFVIKHDGIVKFRDESGGVLLADSPIVFQSYNSIIVMKCKAETYLDETYWDYSTTTSKYRNIFLGETKKETQKKIDSGEYILTDLN